MASRKTGENAGDRFQIIATLSGGRKKILANREDDDVLALVVQYSRNGTITATWGKQQRTYQVLELRIFKTQSSWHRPSGPLEDFVKNKRNQFDVFQRRASKILGQKAYNVFVVMPIQGEEFGSQDEQRIFREYDQRFEAIENVLARRQCVARRIDKEFPLEGLVQRIKSEIRAATFLVADLTDERPSCYFEVGFADALGIPVIYVASKESVVNPRQQTKIHFDIHQLVNYFTNLKQLSEKITNALDKNWSKLTERGKPT